MKAILKFLKALIEDRWTLIGMFIAWAVLEGTLKTITGYLLLAGLLLGAVLLFVKKNDED
jgi:hypothetical protein